MSNRKTIKYYYTRFGKTVSFEARHDKAAMARMVADFGNQLLTIGHVWRDGVDGEVYTIWIE